MSNRCYLVGSQQRVIYPSFVLKNYNAATDTYLASAGCIPLAWLPLFGSEDLTTQTFTPEGKTVVVTAPVAERTVALKRFADTRKWLHELFASNGGLDYHLNLFEAHLGEWNHPFLSIELEEIEALHPQGVVQSHLKACLSALERREAAARDELVWLSTVLADRRFVTLEDAAAGRAQREDQWNFFRLLGEGWERPSAWD